MSAKLASVPSLGGDTGEEAAISGVLLGSLLVMVTMSPRDRESVVNRAGSEHLMSIQIPLSASLCALTTAGLVSSRVSTGPGHVINDRTRAVTHVA